MLGGPQRASSPSTPRKKVPLAPGHSPLDWARLLFSGRDLRGGVKQLARFTPSEVAQHRSRDDCWMAVQGNVYNVTHYIKFHPGGAGQLLRGAGKDATELFMKVHPWVNVDGLLGKCQVGYLVKEREGEVQEGKEGKDSLGV
ncbi:cytochrome b5-like heme/steroid binding domain-containing protein [Fimicolochytrium jonesii]|uniref:cytochrome b5-like heme/steroid binding domain-containing protein n=1 Tax=Fimicolochytrium jonesii TaxID=1396493 RepID=UPI0022FE7AA7|nr:cytochrome b5-like heme/steroid binding domain-containing protein [Fimicolochytrium jonesii]KAI8818425.1 cytochrome b5-like heme/steroid binding domain-containing protein [Fimicolochytrium jonesii]